MRAACSRPGTTGKPKCCVLSNDYFIRLARWYINQGGAAAMRESAEIILTPLPLFHMNALACSALGAILLKSTLVPLDRFHARSWWKTVADSGATIVHYLGVMPAILLKLARRTDRDVRTASGSASEPASILVIRLPSRSGSAFPLSRPGL